MIIRLLLIVLLSNSVFASECISDFTEEAIFSAVQKGNGIYYPFESIHLVDGEHEPVEAISIRLPKSIGRVIKVSTHLRNASIKRGATRFMNELSSSEREIIYRGPNSGWHVRFEFVLQDNCWYLAGASNTST